MKFLKFAPLLLALSYQVHATVACNGLGVCTTTPGVVSGVMGNYDIANDTGLPAYGFEMDYENAHSSEIGFTWDWSRFGAPTIGEYTDANGVPHAVVRYQSPKDANGNWRVHTIPATFPWATGGHSCTVATIDTGCEHFVTGMFASTRAQPTVVKYNWLVDAGNGTLKYGTGIGQPAPGATMAIPALQAPAPVQPPAPAQPAPVQPPVVQVVPVQPAPAEKAPKPPAQWGDPVWLKVTKTTTHGAKLAGNAADVVNMLVDEDKDGNGKNDWQNNQQSQVESEWYLIQSPPDGQAGGPKQQHNGAAEQVGADETITRKYEWFDFIGPAGFNGSYDGETHEQMCDAVGLDNIHGSQTAVTITDPNGDSYTYDCSAVPLVGNYLAGNMVAFENVMPLTQLEKIADTKVNVALASRTTIFGGNSPYVVTTSGNVPDGLMIDGTNGILSGTPTVAGAFTFDVNVTDSDGTTSTHTYTVNILDANGQIVAPAAACSGVQEKILQFTQLRGPDPAFSTPNQRVRYANAAFVMNGTATFAVGELATYSGVKDPSNVFCVADNVTVDPAPAVCNPPLTVLDATTNTCVVAPPVASNPPLTVRDPATNTCVVAPPAVCNPLLTVLDATTNTCVVAPPVVCNPPLTVRDPATNTCVVAPPAVCNPPLTVRDAATNTCVVAPPVVCGVNQVRDATTNTCVPAPTSCVAPAGAKAASDIHAKLTAVNGKVLTIGKKLVTLLDCAKVSYKGTAKAPVVGYDADSNKGYIVNGVTYSTSIIIDDGK